MQTTTLLFLGFIVVQRLSELVIAKINTARLLERGAYEVGRGHYPVMVAMHAAWLGCLLIFGYDQHMNFAWLSVFVGLQLFRLWILGTLGARWTTRIIILDAPLVQHGPFRYLKHPNYVLVVAELMVAPMVLGLVWIAALFTVLNAAMLWVRIGVEGKALVPLRRG
ncbi:membrane protein [Puniceibacterium antarcticum]|uniref:Membrane protein n=2 Tax=Puniceibacterium antarcticum TaxID=1206336 RepID=A0A2G8RJ71_9RHOB|nr:isoprenylcysteine carboxylmethyltransferase family protein [Puniceibacterium antarcticum]PIL21600.1 membrane protein [Puniceibacterium antarcticum]